jgi:ketosteroid isomerase-like protein
MEGSESNAELVVKALTAYQERDDPTLRELMHPEIEIYAQPGMINAGSFTGFEGFKHWTAQWEEAWDEISYEPLEFIEVDHSRLVARVHVVGRGAGSGVEIDREYAYLYEIKDGRSTRFHLYEDVRTAVEAAHGLAREE